MNRRSCLRFYAQDYARKNPEIGATDQNGIALCACSVVGAGPDDGEETRREDQDLPDQRRPAAYPRSLGRRENGAASGPSQGAVRLNRSFAGTTARRPRRDP